MAQYETFVFDPKTMRRSKTHTDVIYDSTRILDRSFKNELGGIVIGTKGHPSRQEINDTLMHERGHSRQQIAHGVSRLEDSQEELRAYNRERERSSPRRWSRILPTRITDFGASVSWLSKKQKAEIKPGAMKILSPKTGGGNIAAVAQAHKKLDKDWGPELKDKPMEVKMVKNTTHSRMIWVDKDDPNIVYDRTRPLTATVATNIGRIIVGVKDNPTKEDIAETIRHEKSHLGQSFATRSYVGMARDELSAYAKERGSSSASEWNRALPTRIKSFMTFLTWVNKPGQQKLKVQAKRILSPKNGGGNEKAICQAQADLAQWWTEKEKPPRTCQITVVSRSIRDITKELKHMSKGSYDPIQLIRPGIGYTKGGRLSRKPRRGWRKVKYA